MNYNNILKLLLFFFFLLLIWSSVNPKNIFRWLAELLPLSIGAIILIKNYRQFKLTLFSYIAIFIGASLMLIGSHYGYAHVPLCEWIRHYFDFERNNYDKIVHFFQGLIMASLAKEIITKKEIITENNWVNFFAICFALAFAGVWEVAEWLYVALINFFGFEISVDILLGTQNYYWDAQSDIFFAILGAFTTIYILGKCHTNQLK